MNTTVVAIVDCNGIDQIENDALLALRDLVRDKYKMLFTSARPSVAQAILRQLDQPHTVLSDAAGVSAITYNLPGVDGTELDKLQNRAKHVVRELINKIVADAYIPFDDPTRRMQSTAFVASGVFDARLAMSHPNAFVWSSLCLADELELLLDDLNTPTHQRVRPVRLLAAALRASPFASAVALLGGRQSNLELVDHIGPRQRVVEEHSFDAGRVNHDYIYVSDFIVGGTEVKVVQGFLRSKGAELKGVVALASLLAPQEYEFGLSVRTVTRLQDARADLTYRVL